jgi:serpin B
MKTPAIANNQFTLDLFAQLRSQPGNLFFSPHSLMSALSILLAGASHETAQEIAAALHVADLEADVHKQFAEIHKDLAKSTGDCVFRDANRVWGRRGLAVQQSFLESLTSHYDGAFETVDFADAAKAVEQINSWVNDQSNGKIKTIISEDMINHLTQMILVNALYFRGLWRNEFDTAMTKKQYFWINPENCVLAPMMTAFVESGMKDFHYLSKDGWDFLELPYKNSELSMLLIKGHVKRFYETVIDLFARIYGSGFKEPLEMAHSLDEFNLSEEELNACISEMKPAGVIVNIPRFQLQCGYEMTAVLKALGIRKMFSETDANFQEMIEDSGPRSFIDAVIQKAFLEVNEVGTEAAAVTASGLTKGVPKFHLFRADHPFLLLIRDRQTGVILFMGRVDNPGGEVVDPQEDLVDNSRKGAWHKIKGWLGF